MSEHRLVGKYVHVINGRGVKIAEGTVVRVSGTVVGSFVRLDTDPPSDPTDQRYAYGKYLIEDCQVIQKPDDTNGALFAT